MAIRCFTYLDAIEEGEPVTAEDVERGLHPGWFYARISGDPSPVGGHAMNKIDLMRAIGLSEPVPVPVPVPVPASAAPPGGRATNGVLRACHQRTAYLSPYRSFDKYYFPCEVDRLASQTTTYGDLEPGNIIGVVHTGYMNVCRYHGADEELYSPPVGRILSRTVQMAHIFHPDVTWTIRTFENDPVVVFGELVDDPCPFK